VRHASLIASARRDGRAIDWSKWLAPIGTAVAIGLVSFAASWGANRAVTTSLTQTLDRVGAKVDSIDRRTARIEGRLGIAVDEAGASRAGPGGRP
jgi:hypothetical protein